jgi:hypothetical protein
MTQDIRDAITAACTKANLPLGEPETFQTKGLPSGVHLRPVSRLSAEGEETIVITATCVQRYHIAPPFNFSTWRPLGPGAQYHSPCGMVDAATAAVAGNRGCW